MFGYVFCLNSLLLEKNDCRPNRPRKYITHSASHYLYKSQPKPNLDCCCHVYAGTAQSSTSKFDRFQNHLSSLYIPLCLYHKRNKHSAHRYFHGKYQLNSLVAPVQTFMARTCHPSSMELHHPISTVFYI